MDTCTQTALSISKLLQVFSSQHALLSHTLGNTDVIKTVSLPQCHISVLRPNELQCFCRDDAYSQLFPPIYYCDMKRKKRRELRTLQSIQQQRFSGFRCNACVCMQNVIYDEAVQFKSAPRENCVFSCVNVRLELQLPSISAPKREASNQSQVHKSERDGPTACVQLLCCSGFKAV